MVIGGGPAGSICARQLARSGLRVMVVERGDARLRLGETCGPRVCGLLQAACGLSISRAAYTPLPTFFSSWGSEELDGRRFSFWQAGDGMALDRKALDRWLLASAESEGVTLLRGWQVTGGRPDEYGWLLRCLVDGEERSLRAGFVVEAMGRTAQSVLQPEVRRFFTDRLVCLSVEVTGPPEAESFAMVESCAVGWWYTVRLACGRQIVSLFTDGDLVKPAESRLQWLKEELASTLHLRQLSDRIPEGATIQVCDARTSIRNLLWGDRWMSIGDAAWSLDPLSGTGVERAITDGVDAATAISRAIDSGDNEALRSHAVSRADAFRESLAVQKRYYAIEARWRDAIFWRRRV